MRSIRRKNPPNTPPFRNNPVLDPAGMSLRQMLEKRLCLQFGSLCNQGHSRCLRALALASSPSTYSNRESPSNPSEI